MSRHLLVFYDPLHLKLYLRLAQIWADITIKLSLHITATCIPIDRLIVTCAFKIRPSIDISFVAKVYNATLTVND